MHFPKACKASGPRRVSRFEGARVETWRLTCEEGGLASEATHIEGLSRKVGEVLVLLPREGRRGAFSSGRCRRPCAYPRAR